MVTSSRTPHYLCALCWDSGQNPVPHLDKLCTTGAANSDTAMFLQVLYRVELKLLASYFCGLRSILAGNCLHGRAAVPLPSSNTKLIYRTQTFNISTDLSESLRKKICCAFLDTPWETTT